VISAVASWVLGLWLAWSGNFLSAPWLHGKLVLVLAMSAIHLLAQGHKEPRG
jgi:protoporphyrinogen IX oxidase